MSSGVPLNSARRTKTYAAADIYDVDGVKTSFASVAAPVALTFLNWNGAAISAVTGVLDLPRTITISRTSAANQYSVNPIVLTGRRGGQDVTESLTPATDDGNDVLRGTQPFDRLTGIAIPADAGTGGSYQIGVQDICAPAGDVFTAVRPHASPGTLNVQYGEGIGQSDALPIPATPILEPIAPARIKTNPTLTAPTLVGLTLYLP